MVENAVTETLNKRVCIETSQNPAQLLSREDSDNNSSAPLPGIDIFLNPKKQVEKEEVVKAKQSIARDYFQTSDMAELYPKLFQILWESTLPCFEEDDSEEHLLTACQLAGQNINCSEIFTRVPTDSGMCCALNTEQALRQSQYQTLVNNMQKTKAVKKVQSGVRKTNGLRLSLDLHSNSVSFGTLDKDFDAFQLFLGAPAEFPVLKERGLVLEPGYEHSLDLTASVVTSREIRDIRARDRNCYFPDEGRLAFYKEYTLTNCRLECGILRVEEELGCIPWYLPKV